MAARNCLGIIANIKAIGFDLSIWGQYTKACPESSSKLRSSFNQKGIETHVLESAGSAFAALENELGLNAQEILYVGKKHRDIECANKAGVLSVLLDDQQNLHFGQQFSISSIDQLLDYF